MASTTRSSTRSLTTTSALTNDAGVHHEREISRSNCACTPRWTRLLAVRLTGATSNPGSIHMTPPSADTAHSVWLASTAGSHAQSGSGCTAWYSGQAGSSRPSQGPRTARGRGLCERDGGRIRIGRPSQETSAVRRKQGASGRCVQHVRSADEAGRAGYRHATRLTTQCHRRAMHGLVCRSPMHFHVVYILHSWAGKLNRWR